MRKSFAVLLLMVLVSLACQLSNLRDRSATVTRSVSRVSLTPTGRIRSSPTPLSPLSTNTPSPEPHDMELEIYGVDWLESGDLLVTLESVDPFQDVYTLILGDARFNCRIARDSDRLLFCAGRNVPQGRTLTAALLLLEGDQIVYESQIYIPDRPASSTSGGAGTGPDLTQNPPGPTSPAPTP